MRYFAFLRAINIGGRVVKMERLREIFVSLGCANVETFIASGNVIFEFPAAKREPLERKIETALQQELGYEVKTYLRNEQELLEVAEYRPFGEAGEGTLYVAFVAAPPSAAAEQKLLAAQSATDDLQMHGREIYWRCRVASRDSKFSNVRLEKLLGMAATMRNINTVHRLVAKYALSRG